MDNGTICCEPRSSQNLKITEVLISAQEKLKEVKYKGSYPTLYDFLNWSLKNSENIMKDISVINSIDNRVILARKLFEIYISVKVTRENTKLGLEKEKLVPKFIRSSNKRLDIRKLCADLNVNKDIYPFYSYFAHPYTYSKMRKNDGLDISTSHMLYHINDYEYQVEELNQLILIYVVEDLIKDINYIVKRLLSPSDKDLIDCYVINKDMVNNEIEKSLEKLNKRIEKKK